MSGDLVEALVRANLALAAAIVAVMLLRKPVRLRFGPLAAYALWLAAPLCALVSLIPVRAPTAMTFHQTIEISPRGLAAAAAASSRPFDLADGLVLSWAIGAALAVGLFVLRQLRFVRAAGRLTPLDGAPGVLRGEHVDAGPLVLGALRPRIVVPADFETRFQGQARALVLAHEDVHLRRGDATINGLVVALQCLCWFNPLVHLAARAMRVDQEIACDAAVIARHPDARRLYAQTLLSTVLTAKTAPLGCHWPAAGPHPLKERLTMLNAASLTPLRRKAGLALVALLASTAAGAVWAANPEVTPKPIVSRPVWVQKPDIADLDRYYPAQAKAEKLAGRAVIGCDVTPQGELHRCKVASELPAGAGFGEAALQLSQHFRMDPTLPDGKPAGNGWVNIPINFQPPR
ncbi:TonB family protein [Caulobacter endophyticus]|uniref:TonB family protein n=1 Tax=Caulobacter endophyticus TaxID=2172652 RepID=UPI00240FDB05|nr:TonB family protein [Caulobacter endophyticus]MDG2530965.1 TonB family protein [Caulobacter endophyticus]